MCKSRLQGGCWIFRFRGMDLTRGEGERPPLELCFGKSEIECSASWSYNIMSTFLTL